MSSNKKKKEVNIIGNIIRETLYACLFFSPFIFILLIAFPGWDYKDYRESHLSRQNKSLIGGVHRAQQAYYFENNIFSNNIFLEYPLGERGNYYNHFLETKDNLAFIYAVPQNNYDTKQFLGINLGENKEKPFYGYIGAIGIINPNQRENDNLKFKNIICKNNKIGIIKPNKPIFKDIPLLSVSEIKE